MYSKPITHIHRTAFVILLDCSTSMQATTSLNAVSMSKADAVATVCNFMLDELLERATRGQEVRNYYDIAVLGYSDKSVRSLISDPNEEFIPIDRLAKIAPMPQTRCFDQILDDGCTTSAFFSLRPWIEAQALGDTPMHMGLAHTAIILEKWCSKPENQDSFPPIVFHITDGEATDAKPAELINIARSITGTQTNDGNTLLINIKLCTEEGKSVLFPSDLEKQDCNTNHLALYEMSSIIPKQLERLIAAIANHTNPGPYRGLALNASPCEVLSILNIGSESVNII